jgi:hypothetical protein
MQTSENPVWSDYSYFPLEIPFIECFRVYLSSKLSTAFAITFSSRNYFRQMPQKENSLDKIFMRISQSKFSLSKISSKIKR